MKFKHYFTLTLLFVFISNSFSQEKKFQIHTIAFYNVENLFDTINNPDTYDEEYTPINGWTKKNYEKKLDNLSRVIIELGTSDVQKNSPVILGVCEVENRKVLEDLVKQPRLIDKEYKIVHFDSPDKRGIDVGFIYQEKHFQPTSYINVPLYVYQDDDSKSKKSKKTEEQDEEIENNKNYDTKSKRIYTRDQLLVTGLLDGEEINVIVNHWPSRSGGEKRSSPYREAAGRLNRRIMDSLIKINPNAKIITMGDLNDGTYNKSVKEGIGAKLKKEQLEKPADIYNPFEQMAKDGHASLFYRDSGDIFDQIMLSQQFISKDLNDYSSFKYWKSGIYNKPFLIQKTGQYKGYPLRNQNGVPGFSDHFPVYVYLLKEINANPINRTNTVNNNTTKTKFTRTKEDKISIPCVVNEYATSFVYDAAQENVLISGKEALFLLKTGKVKPENYKGEQPYSLSEGRILDGSTLFIENITFNGLSLKNTTVTISNAISSPLAIGNKTLSTLGNLKVNDKEGILEITK